MILTLNALVLIDTWWNVNNGGFGTKHTSDNVLIDTWWNVNSFNVPSFK